MEQRNRLWCVQDKKKTIWFHQRQLDCDVSKLAVYTARCYAERGIAMASCLSVRLSVTLRYCDYIGWKSSKIISWLVSLGCSLFATPHRGATPRGTPRNFCPNRGGVLKKWVWAFKSCNISETRQDMTKVTFVTIEDQQEVVDELSIVPISTSLDDFEGLLCSQFDPSWKYLPFLFCLLILFYWRHRHCLCL